MALIDLWNSDRQQITGKRIDQLIAFAGEGKLLDGNSTTGEFRALLKVVTSDVIGKWLDECLGNRFTDFGFVLQDTVNTASANAREIKHIPETDAFAVVN